LTRANDKCSCQKLQIARIKRITKQTQYNKCFLYFRHSKWPACPVHCAPPEGKEQSAPSARRRERVAAGKAGQGRVLAAPELRLCGRRATAWQEPRSLQLLHAESEPQCVAPVTCAVIAMATGLVAIRHGSSVMRHNL